MESALLVLDSEALIQEAERELGKLRSAIQLLERQAIDHDQLDVPAFHRWKNLVCADLLSRKRELEEVLHLLRTQLSFIYALGERGGYDDGEAFFWFAAIQSGDCTVPPEIQRFWRDIDLQWGNEHAPQRKPWTMAGDARSGDHGVGTNGSDRGDSYETDNGGFYHAGSSGGDGDVSSVSKKGTAAQAKALYRKIVKLLHPDATGSRCGAESELWHQMQAAYEDGDVFTLELILARCDRVGTKQLRYSELLALIEDARGRLATLDHALIILAERPSWRFRETPLQQRKVLEHRLRSELGLEISQLLHEQRALAVRLSRMQQEAEPWVAHESQVASHGSRDA